MASLKTRPRSPISYVSTLFFLTLILVALGVLAVYNASVVEAYRDFGNKFYFARQQLQWAIIGLLFMFISFRLPSSWIKRLAFPFFLFSLLLMIIVAIPGIGLRIQGARRWLNIFGFSLQPSELMKLSLVIYLATWLEKTRPLSHFLFILALIIGLTMLQPDLGTAIVLSSSSFLLYYLAGAPLTQLAALVLGGGLFGSLLIFTSPYRRARLATFLNPESDPLGSSYHINQVLIALGAGGWTGVGLGRSRQKYEYLPEATTDSIFAVIGEEIGFLGGLVIIALLVCLALFWF